MKVLVTGASGFIGRFTIEKLKALGKYDIVATSRTKTSSFPADISHISADLLQPGASGELIDKVRPTHLLHFAWNAQPGVFWTASDNLDWSASTLSLYRAFLDAGGVRAVMAGTCAEYDWTHEAMLSEESAITPATFYGIVKDATRRALCGAAEKLGGSVAWGRVFWLYGPGEAKGRLVSDVISAVRAGLPAYVSEGLQRRDFLHVSDVADAFVSALDSEIAGPFNIGSGKAVPIRQIVQMIANISERPDLIHFGARPAPPNDPPELIANIAKITRETHFSPAISLEDGLKAIWNS